MKLADTLKPLTLLLATVSLSGLLQAQQPGDYSLEPVAGDLEIPWGMEWLPDGDMLVPERSGTLYRISGDSRNRIDGLPEFHVNGQGGLLDIKAHPGLQGHLLVGSLGGNRLELLELHDGRALRKTTLLEDTGRIRTIRQGPDGHVYLGIMRLVP